MGYCLKLKAGLGQKNPFTLKFASSLIVWGVCKKIVSEWLRVLFVGHLMNACVLLLFTIAKQFAYVWKFIKDDCLGTFFN